MVSASLMPANADEKRVSLTLKATRANLAKKEKPDLRDVAPDSVRLACP